MPTIQEWLARSARLAVQSTTDLAVECPSSSRNRALALANFAGVSRVQGSGSSTTGAGPVAGSLSVAVTWLYSGTHGSLLLTMLMHSAVNQTVGMVPSANLNAGNPFTISVSLVMWLTAMCLWITAGYFLLRMPGVKGSPGEEETNNLRGAAKT